MARIYHSTNKLDVADEILYIWDIKDISAIGNISRESSQQPVGFASPLDYGASEPVAKRDDESSISSGRFQTSKEEETWWMTLFCDQNSYSTLELELSWKCKQVGKHCLVRIYFLNKFGIKCLLYDRPHMTEKRGRQFGQLLLERSDLGEDLQIKCEIIIYTGRRQIEVGQLGKGYLQQTLTFKGIMTDQDFTDLALVVDAEEIPVHKCVLAARSEVFKAILVTDKDKNKIEINNMSVRAVKELVRYLYTGQLKKPDGIEKELVMASEKYELYGLFELCEDGLVKTVTEENALELLNMAVKNSSLKLKEAAKSFV